MEKEETEEEEKDRFEKMNVLYKLGKVILTQRKDEEYPKKGHK